MHHVKQSLAALHETKNSAAQGFEPVSYVLAGCSTSDKGKDNKVKYVGHAVKLSKYQEFQNEGTNLLAFEHFVIFQPSLSCLQLFPQIHTYLIYFKDIHQSYMMMDKDVKGHIHC